MGYFSQVEKLPPDPILELMWEFRKDARKDKIDLSVGIYYDEQLRSLVLESVKEAEERVYHQEKAKTYLPIDGDPTYREVTQQLIFGHSLSQEKKSLIYTAQAAGGTGALRVGAEFLASSLNTKIYLPAPTWDNHYKIFTAAGLTCDYYPYYDFINHKVEFDTTLAFFAALPEKSIVLLHACCHNPTGSDFTYEQWAKISEVFLTRKLIAFFDMAYQGFGDGLEQDAAAVRLFAKQGHQMFIAFSYSKICGLYAERVGALSFIGESEKELEAVASQIKVLIRSNYSNPPKHGAAIVAELFSNPALKAKWEGELIHMQQRIALMREKLAQGLIKQSKKIDYHYLLSKKGMFCFTGLNPEQVMTLRDKRGIYMTKTGRINLTGLCENNLEIVTQAIIDVI